jgi:hypothetical protein
MHTHMHAYKADIIGQTYKAGRHVRHAYKAYAQGNDAKHQLLSLLSPSHTALRHAPHRSHGPHRLPTHSLPVYTTYAYI